MDSNYEKRLEAEIDRVLKALPELSAPRQLARNVMAEIERRSKLPWYRQPWQMWPVALQAVSLAMLMAVFGGICFSSSKVTQAPSLLAAAHQVGGWFSSLTTIWSTLNVLFGASVLIIKSMGTGFMIGSITALVLGYAMCVGLGTVYVRLGLARR